NWAAKNGLIAANPASGIERPAARRKAADVVLSDDQKARILAAVRPAAARDFVIVLEATGARPGELRHAEARDYDRRLGAIVYKAADRRREDEFCHKTAYTGRDRVIYLDGAAKEIIERLVMLRPTGTLFRMSPRAVMARFRRLRIKLGIDGLTAY